MNSLKNWVGGVVAGAFVLGLFFFPLWWTSEGRWQIVEIVVGFAVLFAVGWVFNAVHERGRQQGIREAYLEMEESRRRTEAQSAGAARGPTGAPPPWAK